MKYLIAAIVLLSVVGCKKEEFAHCDEKNACTQSWASFDQENLKKNDHGCPTAIFIAPNGELEQCP